MELIERDSYLSLLQSHFPHIGNGEGHCVFVSGEAGIGKTSLVKEFCKELKSNYRIYKGTCDALFTPRPLAPLHDIALQLRSDFWQDITDMDDRTALFARFFHELSNQKETSIIVFEDIHWADEATLDFIKFLARRITQIPCLFILTYRDDELQSHNHLRNVLGQLPADSFTRLQLKPLSKEAVIKMAEEKGYNGKDVYAVSGGNPFYVSEILSSYNTGVPENIRDTILSVFNRTTEKTREVWSLMSVIPDRLEIAYLEKFEPCYAAAIENCVDAKILIVDEGFVFFKHELFRRTIETSLSPLKRVALNKRVLDLLQESFEQNEKIERIIHYAKNANEYELVVQYAPVAAKKAAVLGAHIEASKLYFTAIEYYQGNDKDLLVQLYEAYAYECYLTNQSRQAIIFTNKSLELLKEKNEPERIGDCLRFLSRLWWIEDNLIKAEAYAKQAIEVLESQPSSTAKAMAYSNISQLKMFSDQPEECIYWGDKAIAIAKESNDQSTLSDALGHVGSVVIRIPAQQQKGLEMLQKSLELALHNSYHEHAARAYTNLGYNGLIIKDTELAKKYFEDGILYCEENNLDLWAMYLQTAQSKFKLETGNWNESYDMANTLIKNEQLPKIIIIYLLTISATIKMRRNENEDLLPSLKEANEKAFETLEPQRIIQALTASLEYEWITGQQFIEKQALDNTIKMTERMGNIYVNSELAFWLKKARGIRLPLKELYEGYETENILKVKRAAALWTKKGYSYNAALCLFEGDDDDKRKAISLVHELGAAAVYEKMKMEMRSSGIKNIPRGIRKATQANPAFLTSREIDVLQELKRITE